MRHTLPLVIGTLVAGLAAQEQSSSRPQQAEVGAQPTYTFQSALLNGQGVRSLADLRGAPTIIEFWGTR